MAKEIVVATLSVLFGSTAQLLAALTPLSVVSLLVFCLLYTPCVAAIAAIILNLVLPKGGPDQDVVEAIEGASEIAAEGVSALYQSAATGVPAVEHVADADIHVAAPANAAQDGEKNDNA